MPRRAVVHFDSVPSGPGHSREHPDAAPTVSGGASTNLLGPLFHRADGAGDASERVAAARVNARLFGSTSTPPEPKIDRYRLGRILGTGAMGAVWSAHDPQLLREVAIKILLTTTARRRDHGDGVHRLRREARALAALSHPNVVQVYDIVADDSGAVCVVMELIDGAPLNDWLASARRDCAEILDAFAQAGRGLAAAHDAGLVHRDFKPSNVLVGADGRVRVGDFGLARALQPSSSARTPMVFEPGELVDTIVGTITHQGAVVGTPLFMAPEQLRGEQVDARCDQYAFCVALYDAVFGVRPFTGNLHAIAAAKTAGRIEPPPRGHVVPRGVESAILRGLSPASSDRWPQMRDLVAVLDRERTRLSRGRRRMLAAASVIGVAGFALALAGNDERCSMDVDVAELWSAEKRAAIAESLVDRSITAIRTDTRLSEYADALVHAEAEACSSRESARAAALQCLHAATTRMRVAVERLSEGQQDVVGSADALLDDLPDPQACLDPTLAGTELPEAQRTRAAEVTAALASAETLLVVDRFPEALERARAVRADIEAHGDDLPALKSEADALAGSALVELGEYEQGAALLTETHYAATERGDAGLAFRTAYFLTMSNQQRGDTEGAATWLRHAEVAAQRTRPRPSARASLANARAMVLAGSGDFAGAEAAFRDGLAECDADECQRTRSTLLLNLAQLLERNADYEQAVRLDREALRHLGEVFGEESSATIRARLQLTEALLFAGRADEADEQLEVVSALLERWSSPDDDVLVMTDLLAMRTRADLGDLDGALAIGRRRLAAMADDPSPPTLRDAGFLQTHANYLGEGGRHAEAVEVYDRALAIAESVAPGSLESAGIRLSRGYTLALLGRFDAAIEDARTAREVMVAGGAADHPFVALTLTNEAQAERLAGRPERALALDERARELQSRR